MERIPTFGEVLSVNSEKELRALGSLKNKNKAIGVNGIRKVIAGGLFVEKFSLKGRNSYANLYAYIQKLSRKISLDGNHNITETDSDGLFISTAGRYIFALTRADAQLRRNLLDVQSSYYRDKENAKKWRNKIANQIHPDKCNLPDSDRAYSKLDEIYKGMVDEE